MKASVLNYLDQIELELKEEDNIFRNELQKRIKNQDKKSSPSQTKMSRNIDSIIQGIYGESN